MEMPRSLLFDIGKVYQNIGTIAVASETNDPRIIKFFEINW